MQETWIRFLGWEDPLEKEIATHFSILAWEILQSGACPWGFSRQEYWMGCHALLQGIFPTQELNPGLLRCRWILYRMRHQESPYICFPP